MNEIEVKNRLHEIFSSLKHGEKSWHLFRDDLGCCTLMINQASNFFFMTLRFYHEKGSLRRLEERPSVYEHVFSDKNEELKNHEGIVWDKIQSFISKMKIEMEFMNEMGFKCLGYGTYQFNDLIFHHEGRHGGIEIQSKGFDKLIMRTDSSSLNDMDFALRYYGDDPERFLNLPQEARDHVLRSKKLSELAWNS